MDLKKIIGPISKYLNVTEDLAAEYLVAIFDGLNLSVIESSGEYLVIERSSYYKSRHIDLSLNSIIYRVSRKTGLPRFKVTSDIFRLMSYVGAPVSCVGFNSSELLRLSSATGGSILKKNVEIFLSQRDSTEINIFFERHLESFQEESYYLVYDEKLFDVDPGTGGGGPGRREDED